MKNQSAEPWPWPRTRLVLRLIVQWAVVVMAIAAIGLLRHGATTLSERRGNFVTAVTHELRTPLTTLRMYSQMLESGLVAGPEKQAKYLRTLRMEAERLQRLVDNVLTHARLDEEETALQVQPVTLGETLDSILPRLEERCHQAEMILDTQISDHVAQMRLNTDPLALERILFNLIENACKYAASANDRRIHLEAEPEANLIKLAVTDHGPGISASASRRLFEPFYRVPSSNGVAPEGIGLGLSISRRLARRLGGGLILDRSVKNGCRFIRTLPEAKQE